MALLSLLDLAPTKELPPKAEQYLRKGFEVTFTPPENPTEEAFDMTVKAMRRRAAASLPNSEVSREGSNNINLLFPDVENPQAMSDHIGRTGQLQFRQVQRIITPQDPDYPTTFLSESDDVGQVVTLEDDDDSRFRLHPARLTGKAVQNARAVIDPASGSWMVSARFSRAGSEEWARFTGELACVEPGETQRRVAIVLDGRVESAPEVDREVECNQGIVGGETVIRGDFTQQEAKDLALVLNAPLPVRLEQSQVVKFRREIWSPGGAYNPRRTKRGFLVRLAINQELGESDFSSLFAQVRTQMLASDLRDGSLSLLSDQRTGEQQITVRLFRVERNDYSDLVIDALRTGRARIDFDASDAQIQPIQTY